MWCVAWQNIHYGKVVAFKVCCGCCYFFSLTENLKDMLYGKENDTKQSKKHFPDFFPKHTHT